MIRTGKKEQQMKQKKLTANLMSTVLVIVLAAAMILMIPAHVEAKSMTSFEIKSISGNTYISEDTIVTPSFVITVTYDDGTTEDIDLSESHDYSVSGYPDTCAAGEYTATLTYGGQSIQYPYLVIDPPSLVSAEYGQTFADVSIPASGYGTFAWPPDKLTQSVGEIGTYPDWCVFTPYNSTYSSCSALCTVNVIKATLDDPVSISATYGQTLADVVDQLPSTDSGTYAFEQDLSTSVGNVGTNTTSFTASFTPSDTAHYNAVTGIKVIMNVAKTDPSVEDPLTVNAVYGQTLADVADQLPSSAFGTYTFEQDPSTSVGNAGVDKTSFTAKFTPYNTDRYNSVTGIKVIMNVAKADPSVEDPLTIHAVYGQTLADVADQLPSSDIGTYTFEQDPSTSVGNAGIDKTSFTAKFTPNDTANYNTVDGIKINMHVAKADPTVVEPLTVTAVYGQTLADVVDQLPPSDPAVYPLKQGLSTSVGNVGLKTTSATAKSTTDAAGQLSSTVSGTYTFEQDLSTSVGNVGLNTTSFTAKFTPDDTANYNTVTGIKVHMLVKSVSPSQDKTKPAASEKKAVSPSTGDDAAEVLILFSALLATSVALLIFLKRRKSVK